jgi:hypothetical protein
LTETDGLLRDHSVLICDRDRKWSRDVRQLRGDAGVQYDRSNTNASIGWCRSASAIFAALRDFVDHYHRERTYQGFESADRGECAAATRRRIGRRQRLGGLLNYYERAA